MRKFLEDWPNGSPRGALAPPCPDYVEDVVLAADTIAAVPIPAGARFVVFSIDGDFRAKVGVAGTVLLLPTATSADGSGSELNPDARRIPDKLGDGTTTPTHVLLRAAAACQGSLSFWSA